MNTFKKCCLISAWTICLGVLAKVTAVAVQALSGRAVGGLIDSIMNDGAFPAGILWVLGVLLVVSAAVEPLLFLVHASALNKGAFKFHRFVVREFLDKKYDAAMEMGGAAQSSRWENDVISYNSAVVGAMTGLLSVVAASVFLALFGFDDAVYAVVCIAVSVLCGSVPLALQRRLERIYAENRRYEEGNRANLLILINNYVFIVMNGILGGMSDRVRGNMDGQLKNSKLPEAKIKALKANAEFFLNTAGYVAILTYGIGTRASGGTIAFYLMLAAPVRTIVNESVTMFGCFMRFGLMYKRLEIFFYEKENTGGNHAKEPLQSISANNLSYTAGSVKILDGVCFNIKFPAAVRIAGDNGTGKSTLVKIITALNTGGNIKLNGQEYGELNQDSVRSKFAYCEQDAFFFGMTIRQNMQAVNPGVTDERILALMDMLRLDKGLDYNIKGGNLSGGEQQKLSIIRAVIKAGSVLVLDEPSNHLDADAVRGLLQIINDSRSIIIISHDNRVIDSRDFEVLTMF